MLLAVGGQAVAQVPPASIRDCDASAWAQRLIAETPEAPADAMAPVPAERAEARAHGVSMDWLAWPGQDASAGRYALVGAADGSLRVGIGEPVQGARHHWALEPADGPLPPALADRFRHLAPGVRLKLPQGASADWRLLLQGDVRLVLLDADDRVLKATRVQWPGTLDHRFAEAARDDAPPLGVQIERGDSAGGGMRSTWRIWAPTAQAVHLCRHASPRGAAVALHALQIDPDSGVWQFSLPRDASGQSYTFLVDVWVPGLGLVRQRVSDPYAISLTADSRRAWAGRLDDPRTEPPGWRQAPRGRALASAADLVIYELHVRDFSRDDPAVPRALRGKYAAFGVPGSAGLRHLRALQRAGLTDLHLLPAFDFATVPERGCRSPRLPTRLDPGRLALQAAVAAGAAEDCFNWGYDPLHFNAPEGSFATDAEDGAVRLREFRRMVMALHAIGLRVGLDVVYNHLSASGQHPHSVLDRIVPGYYQRLDAAGRVETSTCCANSATEHAMMGKLMRDSVRLWVRHHRIDSFRFDLMGHQPLAEMQRMKAELAAEHGREIHLIGEGWNFGEVANGARFVQAAQLSLAGSGIASFSDRARDALRGGGVGDDPAAMLRRQGLLNGLGLAPNESVVRAAGGDAAAAMAGQRAELLAAKDLLRLGLAGTLRSYRFEAADGQQRSGAELRYAGQPAGYAADPTEVVNYVENHDNPTLWDLNAFKLPLATGPRERTQAQVLGIALTALSQGVAYFHAGIELLRSKSMDANSYDSGDAFNRLDFSGSVQHFGPWLPPERDNRAFHPLIAERLALPQLKARPSDIALARQAMADWLAVRASSSAFRLRTAEAVQQRLRLLDTGPGQQPALVAALLEATGLPGGGFDRLALLVNLGPEPLQAELPALRGGAWRLHPVLAAPGAADARLPREARLMSDSGRIALPARSAAVFVQGGW